MMQRILLVETASPRRVRRIAEEISAGGIYEAPDLTILCRDNPQSIHELSCIAGARLIPLSAERRSEILAEQRRRGYDVVYSFWTGEKQYRRIKLEALRIPANVRRIDIGDGHTFQLSVGNFVRFLAIRWKYPLPSDHEAFMQREPNSATKFPQPSPADATPHTGERILIIQSADPPAVVRALECLRERPLFRDPRYTLFCRNRLEVVKYFRGHPMLSRVITHSETRGALKHLQALRRERFDSVVIFFTGERGYWKIKCLAFLLSARHKVVFNENSDCFFFSWEAWISHISRRMAEDMRPAIKPHWIFRARALAIVAIKFVLLPLRFFWLLLIWLWLRGSSLRLSD